MKKRWLVLCCVGVLTASAMVGCGSGKESTEPEAQVEETMESDAVAGDAETAVDVEAEEDAAVEAAVEAEEDAAVEADTEADVQEEVPAAGDEAEQE